MYMHMHMFGIRCTYMCMCMFVAGHVAAPSPDVLDTSTQSGRVASSNALLPTPCFQGPVSNALFPMPCFQRLASNALYMHIQRLAFTVLFQRLVSNAAPPLPQKNALNVQPRRLGPPSPEAAATCRHLPPPAATCRRRQPPPPAAAASCQLTSAKLLLPHLVVLCVQIALVLLVWGGLRIRVEVGGVGRVGQLWHKWRLDILLQHGVDLHSRRTELQRM